MALTDFWFNKSSFIQFRQNEFYATGLFADAVVVHPEPGFTFDAEILQVPAGVSDRRVQWGWPDDNSNFATGKFDTTDPPSTLFSPFNLVRNGFNNENVNYMAVSYPAYVPGDGINGGIAVEEVVMQNPNFRVGALPTQWIGAQGPYEAVQLDMMVALRMAAFRERMPGDLQTWPSISEETLIEFPSMFLLRLTMTGEPASVSTSSGLPRFYKAGWVAWGHR